MAHPAILPDQSPKAIPSALDGLHDDVRHAYELLSFANRANILVPSDVVAAVTGVRQRVDPDESVRESAADRDAEAKFWNAYGLLSSIKPAYVARCRYKSWFYVWLAVLLVFQLYYVAASLVSNGLQDIGKEWDQASQVTAGNRPDQATATDTAWQQQERRARACAYYSIANILLLGTQGLTSPCEEAGGSPGPAEATSKVLDLTEAAKLSRMRDLIDFFATVFSGYLLPLLYGLLGAYAFVLRKLSEPLDTLNYSHDVQGSYTLRLQVGALSGLAVGWFVNGSQPMVGVGSLPPLAMAFAAGFGSDLLFATLDKIVGAFAPAPASRTAVRTETTVGGVTMTTQVQRETHVTGTSADAGSPSTPAAATGPVAVPLAA